jgi:cephalosporin hydroxylase
MNAPRSESEVVADFHRLYYDAYKQGGTWYATSWLGVPTWKLPLDLWIYQEILHEIRPDLIVETGTAFGGSAFYLASLCDILRGGEVMSIDVKEDPKRPRHERITYLLGSSTSEEIVSKVKARAAGAKTVLVILDSDHSRKHVLAEIGTYAPLVTRGSYLIVEDTNVNGHPVYPDFGPGPMEAVEDFLKASRDFQVDTTREKFLLTFNPRGYLRRVQ